MLLVSTPYATIQSFVEGQEILGTTAEAVEATDPIALSMVVFEDQELPVHSIPLPLVSISQHIDDEAQDMTD